MSLAVKILILLNLVLAMVVAVVTMVDYATSENWKRRWDTDSKLFGEQLKGTTSQITDLSFDKVRAETAVTSSTVRISELTAKIKEQDAGLTEKSAEITRLSSEVKEKGQEISTLRDSSQAQAGSLELARQNASEKTHIAQVARAAAFQLNVKLGEVEDDLNNTKTALSQCEESLTKEKKDNNSNKAMLAILRERDPKMWAELADEKQSASFIQGIVAVVKSDPQGKQDLVVLTIGKNQTVEEGTEFIISRGSDYIVRVRAEKVLTDMISCRVIPESWNKKSLEIKQGDTAQNRH